MAATIYFGGGQDTSFDFVGSVDINTNSSFYRAGWSQAVVEIAAGSTADPPPNHALSRAFINKANAAVTPTTFWCRSFFAWSALGGACTNNAQMFRVLDASGNPRLMVRGAGSGAMKISKRDIGGTFTDLVTSANGALPVTGLSPASLDLYVRNANSIAFGPRTDITFTAGPPGVISTSGGNFKNFGLTVGSSVTISGSASNNGTYVVTTATVNTLSFSATTFVAESPGASVTFTCAGQALLYFNTNLVAAFAGDITTNSVSQMAYVDLVNCDTSDFIRWSETIVSDQPTLTKGLWTRPPLAAGTTQAWLPNTVGNISKATINDTTFISTTGTAEVSTWTGGTSPPNSGAYLVDAIIQEARLAVDNTGPQNGEWAVQINGTLEVAGAIAPTTSPSNFSYTWAENPITTTDWQLTDITVNTLDLGVESLA